MVLYIDACVRKNSRTRRLADCLLNTLNAPYTRLRLEECVFPTVDEAFLEKRDRLLREGDFDNPVFAYARQFAQADEIIIAAPFWDLSFPAVLKSYLEQINVVGITFRYTPEGIPEGLCIQALAQNFYHIKDVKLIKATGLDIEGAPVEKILRNCEEKIRR